MAKRTSGHAAQSGRSPPTGDSVSERPSGLRRSTRSASREPPSNAQAMPERTRGASRQKSSDLEDVAAAAAALDAHRRAGRVHSPDLEPVEEEGSVTYGRLKDAEERNTSIGARGSVFSHGAASNFSAFTGRSTFSQDEIAGLEADVILAEIQSLDNAAEVVLEYVAPQGVDLDALMANNEHLLADSKFRKILIPKIRSFTAIKESFGSQSFINPEHVLRFLLDLPKETELLSTHWRPDEIFYKANLVTLLQMMYLTQDAEKIANVTQTLDLQFPVFALNSLVAPETFRGLVGESAIVEETGAVAAEIRTQVFIQTLEQDVLQEPLETILAGLFLVGQDAPGVDFDDSTEAARLRPFELAVPTEYTTVFYSTVYDRYKEIKAIVAKSNNLTQTVVQQLKELYPWRGCCLIVLAWAQGRQRELRQILEDRGGIESIVGALQQEVHEVESRTDPRLLESQARTAPSPSRNIISKSNIEALIKRRQALSNAHIPASANMTPNPPYENSLFGSQSNDLHLEGREEQAIRQLAGFRDQRQAASEDRENQRRFIDQQHGAQRVTFDETQESLASQAQEQASQVYDVQSPGIRGKKREIQDDEESFEPSQDEGFQKDDRAHNAPHRAPRAPMIGDSSGRNVLPRTSSAHDVSDLSMHIRRERQNPGRAIESLPPPTMVNGVPSISQTEDYQRVRVLAKINTAQMAKPARTRNKFSQEEEERVLDLIATHGPQFAQIKRIDEQEANILEKRTGEDIRFKARNMKVDYLKSGVPLPPNFDDVKLGQKEINQLIRLGVDYEQEGVRSTNHRQ